MKRKNNPLSRYFLKIRLKLVDVVTALGGEGPSICANLANCWLTSVATSISSNKDIGQFNVT